MPPGQNMDDTLTILRSGMWRLSYQLSREGRKRFFEEFLPLLNDTKAHVLGPQRDADSWLMDGITPVEDVVRALGLDDLPRQDEYETLAGFMMVTLRRVPRKTDHLSFGGFRFEVMDVDSHRIDQVMVTRERPSLPPAGGGQGEG